MFDMQMPFMADDHVSGNILGAETGGGGKKDDDVKLVVKASTTPVVPVFRTESV